MAAVFYRALSSRKVKGNPSAIKIIDIKSMLYHDFHTPHDNICNNEKLPI